MTPETGTVLGIDIGFSPVRRSSAICRLDWDPTQISWTIRRFRYDPQERCDAIREVAGDAEVLAAAFDGPFRRDLADIGLYRAVERILTRRVAVRIGKPGPSHVPVGRSLNRATNEAVADVLDLANVAQATHIGAIHSHAVVEAFPNTFLGAMLSEGHDLAKGRSSRSDRYYVHLAANKTLSRLCAALLPNRKPASFDDVIDHDDRAALVCALSGLCIVADRYVMVGDDNGRIVLPPVEFWSATLLELVRENCAGAEFIERPHPRPAGSPRE